MWRREIVCKLFNYFTQLGRRHQVSMESWWFGLVEAVASVAVDTTFFGSTNPWNLSFSFNFFVLVFGHRKKNRIESMATAAKRSFIRRIETYLWVTVCGMFWSDPPFLLLATVVLWTEEAAALFPRSSSPMLSRLAGGWPEGWSLNVWKIIKLKEWHH